MFDGQAMHLRSACEKEIQEIQKKYDVLLNEAENALLQKKLELGSHYKKVYANMLLAEALRCSNEKQTTSPLSAGIQCFCFTFFVREMLRTICSIVALPLVKILGACS